MSDFTAYFTRGDTEYEVTADLYDHGYGTWEEWQDTGRYFEVDKEPEFNNFECYDENGDDIPLTNDELFYVIEQMKEQYWEKYDV